MVKAICYSGVVTLSLQFREPKASVVYEEMRGPICNTLIAIALGNISHSAIVTKEFLVNSV